MKRIKNIAEYIIALIIIILLVIMIISAIVIKFHGDDLEKYTMDLINEKLNTAFEVDEIGVSIFRKFPNTSIYLKNVYIKPGNNYSEAASPNHFTDTLVHAKYLFFKVNAIDILRNNMNVNSLELKNSIVNIFIDEKGNGNFTFNNERVGTSNEFIFDFKSITLEDAKINYLNLAKLTESQFFIKKAELEGNFTKSSFRFSSGLSGNIGLFRIQDNTYIDNTSIKADLSVKVNQNLYDIQKGSFSLGDLNASVSGKILDNKENTANLDLRFNGKNIDILWLSEIIKLKEKVEGSLDVTGKFNINGEIKGLASPTITPDISVFFSSQNSTLRTDLIPSPLKSLTFRGSYSNGTLNSIESSSIIIDDFKTSFDNSSVTGSLIVSDFLEPDFKTTLSGNILLSDFNWLLNKYKMNFADGSLLPKLVVSGKIKSKGSDRKEVEINPMGELKIDNAVLDIYKIPLEIHSINSNLRISNYNVKGTLRGIIGNTDIDSEIEVANTQKYLKNNGQLIINGHIRSKHTDLDELIAGFRSEKADKRSIKFIRNALINVGLEINKLKLDSLNINNLRSDLQLQYPAIYANNIYMQVFGGDISGNMQ
ncbi:MAG TPA: hypothetical protein VJ951_12875, partial [Bacteroidales bacterium]|nr:hypothetical protein [Bacteroidales bacterium]